MLLLNELTRVRKMYDDAVVFIQYQARVAMQMRGGPFLHPGAHMQNPMAAYATLMQHMPGCVSPAMSGFSTVDYDGKGREMFPGYAAQAGGVPNLNRSKSEGAPVEGHAEGSAQRFVNPCVGYPGFAQGFQNYRSTESPRDERGPKLFGVCLDAEGTRRREGDELARGSEKRVKREAA